MGENILRGDPLFSAIDPERPRTKLLVQHVEVATQPSLQFGRSRQKYSDAVDGMEIYAPEQRLDQRYS